MTGNDVIKYLYDSGYRVNIDGHIVSKTGKILKTHTNKWGYHQITVRINKKLYPAYVHRLAAYQKFGDIMFMADCIRHLDGNPSNNTFDNIELGTNSENMLDVPESIRIEHAKRANIYKENFHTDEEVQIIREFHNICHSYKKTMDHFGISSKGTLSYILNKR